MTEARYLTHQEWLDELTARFGPNPLDWAFRCPMCRDVATGSDWKSALAGVTARDGSPANAANHLGRECIGRVLGALKGTVADGRKYSGRGCDWAAYGLFSGPWFVLMTDGRSVASFPIASGKAT